MALTSSTVVSRPASKVRSVAEPVGVLGVGVDGGHQTLDDAQAVVERLGHGGQAVRGARGVGDDRLGAVVLVVVDAHDDGDVLVLRRGGDQDLLGAGVDVLLRVGGLGEEAGGFDHDVHAQLAPRKVGGVTLGEDLDDGAVDDDVAVFDLDGFLQAAADGVVLEEVCECFGAGEVVDCNDLQVRALCECCAEVVAANTAKAVDTNTGRHFFSLLGAFRSTTS